VSSPAGGAKPEDSQLRASLARSVPSKLRVGGGNALVLEGSAVVPGTDIAELRLRIGENEASTVTGGLPAPGQLRGTGWWRAIVPVARVAQARRAPVELRLRAKGGGEVVCELGSIHLDPDLPAAREPWAATGPERRTAGLVAICLATRNPPIELLRRQIDSIRRQTHGAWVCLISDDHSSPATWLEVERLVAGDERFRLTRADERLGFYLNFERALRSVPADAAYVAFADQDDRWDEDKLETLIAALEDGDATLVHSDARVVRANGDLIASTVWPRGAPHSDDLGSLLLTSPVVGASSLFRSSLLKWVLPFPPPVGVAYHDRWVAVVASLAGGIAYVDRPLFDYVQHPGSALGHTATVEPGRRSGESRRDAIRRRYADLRQRGFHPNWRAHDDVLVRCAQEAEVLRLRLTDRMSGSDRRAVARMRSLPSSRPAQARILVSFLTQLSRRRPGRAGALVRAIAWRHLVRVRNRVGRGPPSPVQGFAGAARGPRVRKRIGITVTRDSERAGFGDFQVARELGGELRRLGFEVISLETHRERWRRRIGSVDALISLLDGFPLDQVPSGVLSMAWVRNWTERWLERPWFGDYDVVLASSDPSIRLIEDRSDQTAALMPLATNPRRFRRTAPDPRLDCDVLFAGSRWGVSRQVEEALPALAGEMSVKLFGKGWDAVPQMKALHEGWLAYERLPAAYSSARVVLDDSSRHARPHEAVNSRVLDSLACGTLVVSNDAAGVHSLFDEDFPVWEDIATLRAQAERARRNPQWASRLADRYRSEIIARHTYRHRAEQVRDALASHP